MTAGTGAAAGMTLFVGAGVSVPSGAPDFWRLRNRFLAPLVGQREADAVSSDLPTPELLFDALDDGRPETRHGIRRAMWQACESTRPGPNHTAIARLGAAGATVWTTNFDTLIERAAVRQSIPFDVHAAPDDPPPRAPGPPGRMTLLKIHGTFPFGGDPAVEPVDHDYDLLFRSSDVWSQIGGAWSRRLGEDLAGADARFFGYRGADLDIVPALLRLVPTARTLQWWERAEAEENLELLRRRFATTHGTASVRAGDPSAALQDLAEHLTGPFDRTMDATERSGAATPGLEGMPPPTWTARAKLRGQFRGAASARRDLAMAVLLDPAVLKRRAAFSLVRSSGFDRPAVGVPMSALLAAGAALGGERMPEALWELLATLLDARPVGRSSSWTSALLLRGDRGARPETLVRVASCEKRLGALDAAAEHAYAAMAALTGGGAPQPALEAMVAYNLVWIERQRWRPAARRDVRARYEDRLGHVGFNWAAWLHLDDALLELNAGRAGRAEAVLLDPFLHYARTRIRHPMLLADDELARALLQWHQHGPAAAEPGLRNVLELAGGPRRRALYSAVEALTLLADLERARGRRAPMHAWLRTARASTRSPLQQARADLVAVVARGDGSALEGFADTARRSGHGVIAHTAAALTSSHASRDVDGERLHVDVELPLPGLY